MVRCTQRFITNFFLEKYIGRKTGSLWESVKTLMFRVLVRFFLNFVTGFVFQILHFDTLLRLTLILVVPDILKIWLIFAHILIPLFIVILLWCMQGFNMKFCFKFMFHSILRMSLKFISLSLQKIFVTLSLRLIKRNISKVCKRLVPHCFMLCQLSLKFTLSYIFSRVT